MWKGSNDNPYHVLGPITKSTYHLVWIDFYTCVGFLPLLKSRWKLSPHAPWICICFKFMKMFTSCFTLGKAHGWGHSQNVKLVLTLAFPSIKHQRLSIEMVESLHVIGQEGLSIDEWIFCARKHFQIQRKTWFTKIGATLGSTHMKWLPFMEVKNYSIKCPLFKDENLTCNLSPTTLQEWT
jgi:hypothetical protein